MPPHLHQYQRFFTAIMINMVTKPAVPLSAQTIDTGSWLPPQRVPSPRERHGRKKLREGLVLKNSPLLQPSKDQ